MARQNLAIKSDFFTLQEFIKSSTADRLHISNVPDEVIVRNLQYGVDMILDPLRRMANKPIIITSGFRCYELNKAVGGVENSWHLRGCAADLRIKNQADANFLWGFIKSLPSVDTALFEHSRNTVWLHVQWDMARTPRHHYNFNYVAL